MPKLIRFERDRPPSPARALAKIRAFWTDGCYVPSPYAQYRMAQRHFDDHDIAHLVFMSGRVTGRRKVDGLWRYKVSGKSVDGKPMAAVFEFERDLMTLVTVHRR